MSHSHGSESDIAAMAAAMAGVNGTDGKTSIGAEETYFTYKEHQTLLMAHIALMTISWLLILPIGVMLSIARSRLSVLAEINFLAVHAAGLVMGVIYNSKTPDLYPNNSHHKLGWAVTSIVSVHAVLNVIRLYHSSNNRTGNLKAQYSTIQDTAMHPLTHSPYFERPEYRYSRDSGQGTEPEDSPRHSSWPSPHTEDYEINSPQRLLHKEHRDDEDEMSDDTEAEKTAFSGHNAMDRFLESKVARITSSGIVRAASLFCEIVDRTILILGFVGLATGIVTYGGHFKGHGIFGGMAHFVKGGIFFWYGLLVLGRAMGSFADFGWSWNLKPDASVVGARKARAPTAEFVESLLIFTYGASNVFLEHLGSWGGSWSMADLEHVSITIMFFGGGLCGMLIESRRIRDLLNASFLKRSQIPYSDISNAIPASSSLQYERFSDRQNAWKPPRHYGFSLNPFPAIVILLLGMLMSSHHQSSMVSTMLHKQWGSLFVGAALARAVTYLLVYLAPPTSYLPSRPPSEVVVAFCLVSGGLVFMGSNSDMVAGMERLNLDAMFLFTVAVGFSSFLMAWELIVLAVKGWAVSREKMRT